MKTLTRRDIGGDKKGKGPRLPRLRSGLSRFKDIVVKHPETAAYTATFVASTTEVVRSAGTGKGTMAATGIAFASMFTAFMALAREAFKGKMLSKERKEPTKREKVVTRTMAITGFVVGAGMLLAGVASGFFVAVGSAMAAALYRPVKDIATNAKASISSRAKKLVGGAVTGIGLFGIVLAGSEPGVAGVLKEFGVTLGQAWRIAGDAISAVAGIGVTALGIMMMNRADRNQSRSPENSG